VGTCTVLPSRAKVSQNLPLKPFYDLLARLAEKRLQGEEVLTELTYKVQ
jgi:hypothetical protein